MHLCVISEHKAGGARVIGEAIKEALGTEHQVELYSIAEGVPYEKEMTEFDHVHFVNISSMRYFHSRIKVPTSATIHHMSLGYEPYYTSLIKAYSPTMVHVLDEFTLRDLGRRGVYNTYEVQQYIPKKYDVIPLPDEFAIGYIGGDPQWKRFKVIEEIAKRAQVKCVGHITGPDNWLSEDDISDFYKSISLYVVASFEDGGPIPALEALQCGRHVLTTCVGRMMKLRNDLMMHVHPFDGSVQDGVLQVTRLKTVMTVIPNQSIKNQWWENQRVIFQLGFMEMVEAAKVRHASQS